MMCAELGRQCVRADPVAQKQLGHCTCNVAETLCNCIWRNHLPGQAWRSVIDANHFLSMLVFTLTMTHVM